MDRSGERPALERAVGNLVRNARKHGRRRTVTVTVGGDGGEAFVPVADEGPGPPSPSASSNASTRRGAQGEGSGLGLAIVKAIAERHGGRIEVDGSRPYANRTLPACQ